MAGRNLWPLSENALSGVIRDLALMLSGICGLLADYALSGVVRDLALLLSGICSLLAECALSGVVRDLVLVPPEAKSFGQFYWFAPTSDAVTTVLAL